jgi:hypothetical protein
VSGGVLRGALASYRAQAGSSSPASSTNRRNAATALTSLLTFDGDAATATDEGAEPLLLLGHLGGRDTTDPRPTLNETACDRSWGGPTAAIHASRRAVIVPKARRAGPSLDSEASSNAYDFCPSAEQHKVVSERR